MYREWLAKMLDSAPRGTKARLAEHLGLSGDVVSKMLSGVRDITADELRRISEFFGAMPPGFDVSDDAPIVGDDEILAVLNRIDGIGERGVELAMMAIQTARSAARQQTPSQLASDDRSEPASRRREVAPSR